MGERDDYAETAALLQSLPKMAAYAVRQGNVSDDERRALLDALDVVSRKAHDRDVRHLRGQVQEQQDQAREQYDRAERAEAVLREIVEEPRIRDPFGRVAEDAWLQGARAEQSRQQNRARAALSADADAEPEPWEHLRVSYEGDTATAGELTVATEHPEGTCAFCDQRRDADAEPERPRCLTCEDTGLYPPGNDDGYGCWDCNQPPRRRDGTCAVCDQPRDADAEPSRAEGDKVGEHVWECGCIDDVEADGSHTRAVNCDRHMPPAEGDDGYCRAVQAAIRRLVDRRESGGRHRLDAVERAMLHADAAGAVDAALGSGGVVRAEGGDGRSVAGRWQEHAAHLTNRVRDLEGALREAVGALEQHRRDMHQRSSRPCATCSRSENAIHRGRHVLREGDDHA